MAYQSKDLSVLAFANGFTLWHFTTPDAAEAVNAAGYFNAACDMLRAGDIIIANVETCGAPQGGHDSHLEGVKRRRRCARHDQSSHPRLTTPPGPSPVCRANRQRGMRQ